MNSGSTMPIATMFGARTGQGPEEMVSSSQASSEVQIFRQLEYGIVRAVARAPDYHGHPFPNRSFGLYL